MEEKLLKEVEALREDVNMLAKYIKNKEADNEKSIKTINDDLKSLEKDLMNKILEMSKKAKSTTTKNDVTYIQNLIQDDFKEMQTNLLNQVEQIINTLRGENKK